MSYACEAVRPMCPKCRCEFRYPDSLPFFFLLWSRCWCGWCGLARYWKVQS